MFGSHLAGAVLEPPRRIGEDRPEFAPAHRRGEVDARIKSFDSEAFNLEASARDFASDPPIQKRKLLELVAAVRDADDEIDLAEDDYLRNLGLALGMKPAEFADLTLEIEVEDLKENFASLRSVPPPPPKKK